MHCLYVKFFFALALEEKKTPTREERVRARAGVKRKKLPCSDH